MIALIRAELRKNWKTGRFFIAILCFLCFMTCSYLLCIQKDRAYKNEQTLVLHYEHTVSSDIASTLLLQLQYTPYDQEEPGMRERYKQWNEVYNNVKDFAFLRQAPEYFGYDTIANGAYKRSKSVLEMCHSDIYDGELDESGQDVQDVQNDVTYYSYLAEHNISMYSTPYEPTLLNFILLLFQNETMILLIVVTAFIIADQICHDFDCGVYKTIYTSSLTRSNIMSAKIINSFLLILCSFIVALSLFAIIPISQHGFGSLQYPYILQDNLITYLPLLMCVIPFVLMVLIFYLSICTIVATLLKNTTNTLLFVSGILIGVYFIVQFFGFDLPYITWLPIFYLYPLDIVSGGYSFSYLICSIICLFSIVMMYIFSIKTLEHIDLQGNEAV